VDFEDAGELSLFIDDSQVSLLEDMMAARGFLDTRQMAGAFQLLRSNDLVWSRRINEYLLGKRAPMTDLMAWNADATRMPYRMHSEYLRRIFLRNAISAGRYAAAGGPVALSDIANPIFAIGTTWDHVAPWRSVYKIGLYTDSEVTFLLTSGGHNAGIVNAPGRNDGSYQVATRRHGDPHVDPDTWLGRAPYHPGSWWPEWQRWLAARSGTQAVPPRMGNPAAGYAPLGAAPGEYVLQR
jgi:polyhydroxyalkanoate synthase